MMLKTFAGDNPCNVDITGDRTLNESMDAMLTQTQAVGIYLADPRPGQPPPPTDSLWDQELPILDDDLGDEGGAPAWVPAAVLGGVALLGGALIIKKVRS